MGPSVKPSAGEPVWEKLIYMCVSVTVTASFSAHIYSQVHKYWDIDTILTFLALYTTTMDFKWNEQDVL